jgi:hypothetical protein
VLEALISAFLPGLPAEGKRLRLQPRGRRRQLRLAPSGNALKLTGERIQLEGEKSFSPDLMKGGDDRVFVLQPSPRSVCKRVRG